MEKYVISDVVIASQGQRFLNYLIDFIVQVLLVLFIELIIILISNAFGIAGVAEYFENTSRIEDFLIGAIACLIYFIPMETLYSRSIGKYITGTVVVMEDGTKPSAQTILARSFWRIVPFDAFTFLDSNGGWHDTKSETFVVRKDDFEKEKELFFEIHEIGKDI